VFALGIALFEMLGLRRLFQRKTDYLTFRAVMEQPLPDIRSYRPDTPDALAAVVTRALDRDPSVRFDTARQLSAAVLDAIAADGRRPWSQGELGDFIRNAFADDLVKRTEQVANATHRTQPGTPRALFTPADVPETASPDDFDEDTEFLPVDTTAETPSPGMPSAPPLRQDTTPTPFSLDSTTSSASLQPVVLPAAAPPRRNLLWPIIAVGMFLVAGGALALVWRLSTQAPPAQVTISTPGTTQVGTDDRIVVAPPPSPPPPPSGSAQVATGSAATLPPPSTHKRVSPPPAPASSAAKAYDVVITAHSVALSRCAKDHPGDAPPSSAQVRIAPSGRPVAVTLEPAALNATELGACLKNVLQALQFPTAAMEVQVTFPFHVKST
jgi:serine/threonine-protein kinase